MDGGHAGAASGPGGAPSAGPNPTSVDEHCVVDEPDRNGVGVDLDGGNAVLRWRQARPDEDAPEGGQPVTDDPDVSG